MDGIEQRGTERRVLSLARVLRGDLGRDRAANAFGCLPGVEITACRMPHGDGTERRELFPTQRHPAEATRRARA